MSLLRVSQNPFEAAEKLWARITEEGLERDVLDAAEEVAQDLVIDLLHTSARVEAWEPLRDFVVYRSADDVWVGVDPTLETAVFELEYGTAEQAPSPVMRSTVERSRPELSKLFEQRLADRLFGGVR